MKSVRQPKTFWRGSLFVHLEPKGDTLEVTVGANGHNREEAMRLWQQPENADLLRQLNQLMKA